MAVTQCRYFTGYKPCDRFHTCSSSCPAKDIPDLRILVVHLGALGAVLRSTSHLPAIKRKFPSSHITWITDSPADQLLYNNPFIDRVLTSDMRGQTTLSALEFDIAFCIDKSLTAAGILSRTKFDLLFGFTVDTKNGSVVPATASANDLWQLGISDEFRFRGNKKTKVQLIHEAMELGRYRKDPYVIRFTDKEKIEIGERRRDWAMPDQPIIGINTGCSGSIPFKKLTVAKHRDLVKRLKSRGFTTIVLLGGKEDSIRNQQIAHGLQVIQSNTGSGLRDGLLSVAACDVIVTGDSLGMHMGIALKKWVVAWFGPTVSTEIEFFGRGERIISPVRCGPCWKRACHKVPMCYDLVSVDEIVASVVKGSLWPEKTSLFKQHSWGTSS